MINSVDLPGRFQVILHQERTSYRCDDYLTPSSQIRACTGEDGIPMIDKIEADELSKAKISWRQKMCQWKYEITDHYELDREIVGVSMAYLDRYMGRVPVHESRVFQLVAVTSLYLAIKLYSKGLVTGRVSISLFVGLSKGFFEDEQLSRMESKLLDALGWKVHPPTPIVFVQHFLLLFLPGECAPPARKRLFELARFLVELSACDFFFAVRSPSSIGLAALLEAMEGGDAGGARPPAVTSRSRVIFCARVLSVAGVNCHDPEVMLYRERIRALYFGRGLVRLTDEDTYLAAAAQTSLSIVSP